VTTIPLIRSDTLPWGIPRHDYRSNVTFGLSIGFVSRSLLSAGAFEFFEWNAPIGDRNCQPGDVERRQFGRRKSHLSGFRHFLSLK
jgi:hypothetical protein